MNKLLPAQPNKSLIDGILVLQELTRRGKPVSTTEMACDLKMEKTRVNRLLKTLKYLGLSKSTEKGRYLCGDGMHVLSAQSLYGSGLLRVARRHLEALQEYGVMVALGVLWRDKTSYLYQYNPKLTGSAVWFGGDSYPLGISSVGMVLMALLPDEDIREILADRPIDGFSGSTEDFLTRMATIRQAGYADIVTDHRSMAVTIGTPGFAALAFSGDITNREKNKYLRALQNTARQIEEDLKIHQKG